MFQNDARGLQTTDDLQAEIARLQAENAMLRNELDQAARANEQFRTAMANEREQKALPDKNV